MTNEAYENAFKIVGEFFFHFSSLEDEMNIGIGKLLGLDGDILSIVTSNMDFYKKNKRLGKC
ncbi:MAG TPA: hypothetical protein VLZ84_10550 [Asticcacaulis sp.]|nr:hypothetical protein [Asticcacaulis sp.]